MLMNALGRGLARTDEHGDYGREEGVEVTGNGATWRSGLRPRELIQDSASAQLKA